MHLFDFLKTPDINRGIDEFRATSGALLLDVRTADEYREGHIPGARNLPLQQLDKIADLADNRDIPLYLYCLSGARSRQAAALLERMGYRNVKNLGGISAYTGKVE